MKTFKITKEYEAVCESQRTRYGFRHVATLLRNGQEVGRAKACYYNRTWESFEFESVLRDLLEDTPTTRKQRDDFFKRAAGHACDGLKGIAAIAMMGDIFGRNQKEKNDWKERMLKAGLEGRGLIMPEDWAGLSEEEKERRLDGAIKGLAE